MYWLSVLSVAVLAAVPLGLATPLLPRWDDMKLIHSWGSIPEKWECQGNPPAGTTIDLRVALKPQRENALIDALYEVSDPRHSKYVFFPLPLCDLLTQPHPYRYGVHLSKEQVAELVAPHPDTLELVDSWLAHHEVPSSAVSITHGGNWMTIYNVPLTKANSLLGAEYQFYRHAETNETVIRTISYALPTALHDYIQTVAPTTYFGAPRALRRTSKVVLDGPKLPNGDLELQDASATFVSGSPVPPSCSFAITPTCLRMLYNTLTYSPQATSKNKLGVTEYLQQFANQSDLTKFLTRFRSDAVPARLSVVTVNGGTHNQSQPGVEVRLAFYVKGG